MGCAIMQIEKPTTGQIIKKMREIRKVPQEKLAELIYFGRTTLSNIETGIQECSDDLLNSIKEVLDLDGLPIHEHERSIFKNRLHEWYNIISERRYDEAKVLREALSIIQYLPHDIELNNLFSLFDCRLLLNLNELDAAKKILDDFECKQGEIGEVQLYHHYYNQGIYNAKKDRNEIALDYYLKSYEAMKFGDGKNINLYFNIAHCYERLGYVSLAITFLEDALTLDTFGKNNVPEFHIYNALGVCYSHIKLAQRARVLLDKAHAIAVNDYKENASKDNKLKLCMVLTNRGYMYRLVKTWHKAIEYLDKAAQYTEKEHPYYLEILYQKARTLMEIGRQQSCLNLINEGVELSKDNEEYAARFKALGLLRELNEKLANELEDKILPYFQDNNIYMELLDFAIVLRDYYKTQRASKKRALKMSDIACTILNRMLEGGVIE